MSEFNPELCKVKALDFNNAWCEGYPIPRTNPNATVWFLDMNDDRGGIVRIKTDTICRCTGRLVGGDRLVFESDCFCIDNECYGVIVWDDDGLWEVEYYDKNPVGKYLNIGYLKGGDCLADLISLGGYEFIGNIHDKGE